MERKTNEAMLGVASGRSGARGDAGVSSRPNATGSAGKAGQGGGTARPPRRVGEQSRRAAMFLAGVLILLAGVAATPCQVRAQGVDAPKPEATPDAKKRVEPRGRLPAYYSQVIDKEQRDKIYAIQARILADIQKLQDQIAMLEQQREKEVREVLTPEQLAKVQKMTDDAKAKRAETSRKKKLATVEQPAGEAPPE